MLLSDTLLNPTFLAHNSTLFSKSFITQFYLSHLSVYKNINFIQAEDLFALSIAITPKCSTVPGAWLGTQKCDDGNRGKLSLREKVKCLQKQRLKMSFEDGERSYKLGI